MRIGNLFDGGRIDENARESLGKNSPSEGAEPREGPLFWLQDLNGRTASVSGPSDWSLTNGPSTTPDRDPRQRRMSQPALRGQMAAQEDATAAIAGLDEAIRLDPSNAIAHYYLAAVRVGEKGIPLVRWPTLIRLFASTPLRRPFFCLRRLGLDHPGDFDKAIADLSEALKIDPNNAEAYFSRGQVWHVNTEYDKANFTSPPLS